MYYLCVYKNEAQRAAFKIIRASFSCTPKELFGEIAHRAGLPREKDAQGMPQFLYHAFDSAIATYSRGIKLMNEGHFDETDKKTLNHMLAGVSEFVARHGISMKEFGL